MGCSDQAHYSYDRAAPPLLQVSRRTLHLHVLRLIHPCQPLL